VICNVVHGLEHLALFDTLILPKTCSLRFKICNHFLFI